MKPSKEYKNFDDAMEQLLKVPHSEIKKKLDAEKQARKDKKKGDTNNPSGSRRG
jgi:hypothetical protein